MTDSVQCEDIKYTAWDMEVIRQKVIRYKQKKRQDQTIKPKKPWEGPKIIKPRDLHDMFDPELFPPFVGHKTPTVRLPPIKQKGKSSPPPVLAPRRFNPRRKNLPPFPDVVIDYQHATRFRTKPYKFPVWPVSQLPMYLHSKDYRLERSNNVKNRKTASA